MFHIPLILKLFNVTIFRPTFPSSTAVTTKFWSQTKPDIWVTIKVVCYDAARSQSQEITGLLNYKLVIT